VAEGVETQEQLDFLIRLECDTIQGYFLSEPVPAQQFAQQILQPNFPAMVLPAEPVGSYHPRHESKK
jgi:EAL domain-containing protein (putative c-di-GMP-specific phosphodiesterase class I)